MICLHNGIYAIEFKPLQEAGIANAGLWKKWVRNGAEVLRKGGNGRSALLKLDSIPEKYQAAIKEVAPSPEKEVVKKGLAEYLVPDQAAINHFATYRLSNGEELPKDHQHAYAANASVFNAIKTIYSNQAVARRVVGTSMKGFWPKISEAVNSLPASVGCDLPTVYTRLQKKYDLYIKGGFVKLKTGEYHVQGYDSLISKKFCHENSRKITPEMEQWFVVEMANTRLSVEMLYHQKFLVAAKSNNWRTDITADAFRKLEQEPRVRQLIQLKRHGRKAFRQENGQTFKLDKPFYSNDIWVSDGTAINWYFRNGNQVEMATTYMVMDSRSKKYLGWSTKYGINKEDFNMQLCAYRMALRNAGAKPYQLLFDNQGGHKNHTSRAFYKKMATVVFPTRAYRPSGKPIEQSFKDFQTLKMAEFPFWTGFGRPTHATVSYRPDMEGMKQHIDLLPTYEELVLLFDVVVEEWNDLNFNGKGSPNEIYAQSINPEQMPLALEELADMFWNETEPIKYHEQGLYLIRNREKVLFEVYTPEGDVDYAFRRNYLHQKFIVKYDPDGEYTDIGLYQLHPTGGLQKIATASPKRSTNRSVKYHKEGDVAWVGRQMDLEEQMMDLMDKEMEEMGFDETKKWSSWRDRLQTPQTTQTGGLYGPDGEGSMEEVLINK